MGYAARDAHNNAADEEAKEHANEMQTYKFQGWFLVIIESMSKSAVILS